jgi:hypothetical protein
MKNSTLRRIGFSLVLVIVASSLALVAGSLRHLGPSLPSDGSPQMPGGVPKFTPCPTPACMAPCQYPPQPQVVCRDNESGATTTTSYACCCCGGGGGESSFQPL